MTSKLATLRKERLLTQGQLGALVNLSQSSVSNFETGRRPAWPRARKSLAMFYGIPERELFNTEGRPL